jgi:biopolymer transport protein ExbD
MGKLSEKAKLPEAEITSASMADIAFLLIIFFMVTTVFSATKGLDFQLPSDDDKQQQTEKQEAIFFKVLEDGSFLMDGQPAVRESILPYIQPKLANWPEKPIIIYSRPQAPYKTMITIYDALMQADKPVEEGGLGLEKAPNISIPTYGQIREYETVFGYNPFEQQ